MTSGLSNPRSWGKLLRYARIYGWRRAAAKAAGRGAPIPSGLVLPRAKGAADVSFIGCGQAAFGTLCYFLREARGQAFLHAYDPAPARASQLAKFYGFESTKKSAVELLDDSRLRTVYIASNHASHAGYAVAALSRGLDVFVEKPIATTWNDLGALEIAARSSAGRLYVGYNRPFSAAVTTTRDLLANAALHQPMSMHCRVQGHVIPPDHWYRKPEEGTRISGNAGHWIDLFIHLLTAIRKTLPRTVNLELIPENISEPDDNYRLTIEAGKDILVLDFTSYSEPSDGVHERIDITCGDDFVEIDDFRSMRTGAGKSASTEVFRPKDVGHRRCTLHPWLPASEQRDLEEVWCSARLVLHAADLARRGGGRLTVDVSTTPDAASFERA